jgi:hypothetical protein
MALEFFDVATGLFLEYLQLPQIPNSELYSMSSSKDKLLLHHPKGIQQVHFPDPRTYFDVLVSKASTIENMEPYAVAFRILIARAIAVQDAKEHAELSSSPLLTQRILDYLHAYEESNIASVLPPALFSSVEASGSPYIKACIEATELARKISLEVPALQAFPRFLGFLTPSGSAKPVDVAQLDACIGALVRVLEGLKSMSGSSNFAGSTSPILVRTAPTLESLLSTMKQIKSIVEGGGEASKSAPSAELASVDESPLGKQMSGIASFHYLSLLITSAQRGSVEKQTFSGVNAIVRDTVSPEHKHSPFVLHSESGILVPLGSSEDSVERAVAEGRSTGLPSVAYEVFASLHFTSDPRSVSSYVTSVDHSFPPVLKGATPSSVAAIRKLANIQLQNQDPVPSDNKLLSANAGSDVMTPLEDMEPIEGVAFEGSVKPLALRTLLSLPLPDAFAQSSTDTGAQEYEEEDLSSSSDHISMALNAAPESLVPHVSLLLSLRRELDALRYLCHTQSWAAAMILLIKAEEDDGFVYSVDANDQNDLNAIFSSDPTIGKLMQSFPTIGSMLEADMLTLTGLEHIIHTVTDAVMAIPLFTQKDDGSMTIRKSGNKTNSGAGGSARVSTNRKTNTQRRGATVVSRKSVKTQATVTATMSALKWPAASRERSQYFCEILMYAFRCRQEAMLTSLWRRYPQSLSLPSVLAVLNAEMSRQASNGGGGCLELPSKAVFPALVLLAQRHGKELDELSRSHRRV